MQNDYSDPRWQKLRLLRMEKDGWRCVACGDTQSTLHVHHKRYCGNIWDSPLDDLQTLCGSCHASLGPHAKAGIWFQRVGDIQRGDCRNKTWTGTLNAECVVLAIQHCPSCAGVEFHVTGNELHCLSCGSALLVREHMFLHSPACVVDVEQQKAISEAKEAVAKRKAAMGQLTSWAAKCRKLNFSDAEIWAAVFPEHAVPLGYQLDPDGLFSATDMAAEDMQKMRAWLTSGMCFSDVVWEVAGVAEPTRKALAKAGY